MKKRDIEKKLKKAGFTMTPGGNHDIWNKSGFRPIPVPRHSEINENTARDILNQAGLREKK